MKTIIYNYFQLMRYQFWNWNISLVGTAKYPTMVARHIIRTQKEIINNGKVHTNNLC